MNKQEEIREGIAKTLYRFEYDGWDRLDAGGRVRWLARADAVMNKEHSQGVVIKVDRELPDTIPDFCVVNLYAGKGRGYPKCMVGYVVVESLIKEVHNEKITVG